MSEVGQPEQPPSELIRFAPRSTSPTWSTSDFAAWLRARAAWRAAHTEPLPDLPTRERVALSQMSLPAALVAAEKQAPRKPLSSILRRPYYLTSEGDV